MIKEFTGVNRFLSNFWPAPVVYDGRTYPTVEHAYQAAKTENFNDQEKIRLAPTPGQAKRLGRTVHVRADWDQVKVLVMYKLLKQKFSTEPNRTKLQETIGMLQEGNNWHDTFWGVSSGVGSNILGQLLMIIREEIDGNE